jgi:hypothetical protein
MAKRVINLTYRVNSKEIKEATKLLSELDKVVTSLKKKGIIVKATIK